MARVVSTIASDVPLPEDESCVGNDRGAGWWDRGARRRQRELLRGAFFVPRGGPAGYLPGSSLAQRKPKTSLREDVEWKPKMAAWT